MRSPHKKLTSDKKLVPAGKKKEQKLSGKGKGVRTGMKRKTVPEVQHEKLHAANRKIKDSQSRYTDMYDFAPVGYFTFDKDGIILEMNLTGAEQLAAVRDSLIKKPFRKFIDRKDREIFVLHCQEVLRRKGRRTCEIRIIRNDNSGFNAQIVSFALPSGDGKNKNIRSAITNITEHKKIERELHFSNRLLAISNEYAEMPVLLDEYVKEVRNFIKCSAVGIRLLNDNGNIPYIAHDGYTRKFFNSENPLSIHKDRCICINVIRQNTIPAPASFTAYGSFYSNSMKALHTSYPAGHIRNTCSIEGYESLAVVPIISEGSVLGLIHVADTRENSLPAETVHVLEKASVQLGIAIRRIRMESSLQDALYKSRRREAKISALLKGSRAVLDSRDFNTTARFIFDSCKNIIGACAGYIALLSDDGTENEVLFLDPGGFPCSVNPDLPMPVRGLRAEAYRSGQPVYHNDFQGSPWTSYMPEGHVPLKNVLFAPLVIEGNIAGVLGLANKEDDFTENDIRMANAFSELASIALRNSRNLELLENSEERFRSVAETANDAIISIDSRGSIVLWNRGAEKIFGHTAEEAVGRPLTLIIPDSLRITHTEGLSRVISEGKPKLIGNTVEIVGLRKNGSTFPIELSLAKWKSREGLFFTGIIRDITQRKETEEELRRHREQLMELVAERTSDLERVNEALKKEMAERIQAEAETLRASHLASLGELAAGVAHEINNPVNGIINYTQILANKSTPGSKEHDIACRIIKEGDRIAGIVKCLLSFARDGKEQKYPVHILEIISDTLALTEAQIRKDGIKLLINVPAHLPEIIAQPQHIQQVFLNLISNARYALNQKYRGENRKKIINITGVAITEKNSPYVRITFYDNGTGISDDIINKVMNPFVTTKPTSLGTGLGLSISHGIVADHGGSISIDSVEGQYTRAIIKLPVNMHKNSGHC
ncbi:MAG: PAS domain S-box protein [Nitrospiraceae bacterium]|nr:MAG: PAS domain S-box protein [Nitrospiraceae bacterium]